MYPGMQQQQAPGGDEDAADDQQEWVSMCVTQVMQSGQVSDQNEAQRLCQAAYAQAMAQQGQSGGMSAGAAPGGY